MSVAVLVGATVTAIAIQAVAWWAKRRTAELKIANAELDQFYAVAQRLIKDESIPISVIEFIENFSGSVGRPQLVRRIASDVATGKWGTRAAAPKSQFSKDLNLLNEDQFVTFAQVVVFGLLASASADPFLAPIGRRAVEFLFLRPRSTNVVESTEKAREVAISLAPELHRHVELATA